MRSLIVTNQMLESDPERFHNLVAHVREHLVYLSDFYPLFSKWYEKKVIPGLVSGDRTLMLRYVDGKIGGIAITKDDGIERKLCCLRILPHLNGSGLGLRLFDEAFEILGTDRPLLSVSEEQLSKFDRVFAYYGFRRGGQYKNLYRAGSIEYSFNGQLLSNLHTTF